MKETVDVHFQNMKDKNRKLKSERKFEDSMVSFFGSWKFMYIMFFILAVWMGLNVIEFENAWDPYPFFFLNFVINSLMFILMPIILMSQRRQDEKSALKQEYDYAVNRKAEKEIEELKNELDEIKSMLKKR